MGAAIRETAPTQDEREDHQERLARARAVLGTAERSAAHWGGRIDRTALRSMGTAQHSAPADSRPAEADESVGTRLPVPSPLAELFPRASLRAGSSVAIDGAATTSLLLALAAAAVGEEAWCAIAGMPDLGLRSALDAGLDPCRLAITPADGEQRPQVLSALADGVGVLVLGPHLQLTPALWRSLLGRARSADTLVLAAAPPGRADLTLTTTSGGWAGLGEGSGRLRRRRVAVTAAGRGLAGQHEAQVLLPQVNGLLEAAPAARSVRAASGVDIAPTGTRLVLHSARRAG